MNEDPSAGVAELFVAVGLFLKCLGLLSQVTSWVDVSQTSIFGVMFPIPDHLLLPGVLFLQQFDGCA